MFSDNIFSIKSWTKKKFAFDETTINKAFGIPEDFDYLDWFPAFCYFKTKTPREGFVLASVLGGCTWSLYVHIYDLC